jgi:hypothetical protein
MRHEKAVMAVGLAILTPISCPAECQTSRRTKKNVMVFFINKSNIDLMDFAD